MFPAQTVDQVIGSPKPAIPHVLVVYGAHVAVLCPVPVRPQVSGHLRIPRKSVPVQMRRVRKPARFLEGLIAQPLRDRLVLPVIHRKKPTHIHFLHDKHRILCMFCMINWMWMGVFSWIPVPRVFLVLPEPLAPIFPVPGADEKNTGGAEHDWAEVVQKC